MEIALIHKDSLLLGPIGFNVRMINSELEDLELVDFITPKSYTNIPMHFSDGLTHLLPIEKIIPSYDSKYENIGNFNWEIVKEDDIPIKVSLTYPVVQKTLDEVKNNRKQEIYPIRKRKEDSILKLIIDGVNVEVSTSREERVLLTSKLSSSPGTHNFKFLNTWLEITTEQLQYVIGEIDKVVQSAFDWELEKTQEIDSCNTIDEVYSVVIKEDLESLDFSRRTL